MSDGDLPWNKDAPEGMAWACPDCEAWATLGGNAAFHASRTGHGRPQLVAFPKRPQQGVQMNPVTLKFRHGGEMLVSPIGLRFVEDPEHGPLVLIPELSGPKAYQLDMTPEEAEQALVNALRGGRTSEWWAAVIDLQQAVAKQEDRWADEIAERLDNEASRIDAQHRLHARNVDRWEALQIHLGLPEGWEHLNEEAAEAKGALVSQAEILDKHEGALVNLARWFGALEQRLPVVEKELSLLKEEVSLFTLAERVGELEESRSLQLKRLANLLEDNERIRRWIIDESLKTSEAIARIEQLESWKSEVHPELNRDTAFPMLDERTCVQRTATVPPITIAWSKDGPVDAFTGKPIAVESWTAPQVGEPSSAMFDRLRAAEKPKSAWKPLTGKERTPGHNILIRLANNHRMMWIAKPSPKGYSVGAEVKWSLSLNEFDGYEFCPIPE